MSMNYVLYGNGSCGNHGCEAIYRGTKELLKEDILIQSENIEEDKKYGMDRLALLHPAIMGKPSFVETMSSYAKMKIKKQWLDMDGIRYLPSIKELKGQARTALSAGGDNYCYGYPEIYAWLNRAYHKEGFKTVLWGCSVEPDLMKDERVAEDLRTYDLICARESITYEAIHSTGANVIYSPDPAFFMKAEAKEGDAPFAQETVGINCSPMIVRNEKTGGIAGENYAELISYILRGTSMNVALIPHVVWQSSDDRTVLNDLYETFKDSGRVTLVSDRNACELKAVIADCALFVGARTHATIAAYSSGVPTLTVGYSVKARGIAKDLFGEGDNYTIPVQSLQEKSDLTKEFIKLYQNRESVKEQLAEATKDYRLKADEAVRKVKSL